MRRRAMMGKAPTNNTITTDGLLFWFDGKDIDSSSQYWESSSSVTTLIPAIKVKYATSGNTIHNGECLERKGTSGGASSVTANGTYHSYNPFYTAGMSQTSDVTMEVLFIKGDDDASSSLFGGTASGATGANSYYRYQVTTVNDNFSYYFHNGSGWIYIDSGITLLKNTVYHAALCISNGTMTFYLNGEKLSEKTESTLKIPIHQKNGLIGIGRYNNLSTSESQSSDIKVYSLSMYNRVLSQSEIALDYNVLKNRYNL